MIRRTITLLTITGLLTFQWALPALAYGQDYGTAYCGSNNIAVRHRTYGQTFIQVPNGTTVDTRNYPTFKVSTTTTLQSGTRTWRVLSTTGDVDGPNTWAFCWGQ